MSAIVAVILGLIVLVLAIKVIGALFGLVIGIGAAVLVYFIADKLIGQGR